MKVHNLVMLPFNFGKDEDYWPEMPSEALKTLSDIKVVTNHNRLNALNKTIRDVKKKLNSNVER